MSEFKSEMQRSGLNSLSARLGPTKLCKESSSGRVQVGNTSIRVKLTSDKVRCDQAPRRVQPASSKTSPAEFWPGSWLNHSWCFIVVSKVV